MVRLLLGIVLTAQIQGAATPTLLGSFATQLSPQDVANLEAVLPGGAKPWLLSGGCGACEASISS